VNTNILHKEVQEYIQNNLTSDISKLILKGSPFEEITVQELANQIVAKQKSKTKLPLWFSTENIYYPQRISIEQTSSEITAQYKSKVVKGVSIIDLTGGFGIDAYFFSKTFKHVVHCEHNAELSSIVSHNYQQLGIENIQTFCGDGIDYLKNLNQSVDCIYIDPSRRHDQKGKVFLLKDCEPNVPEHLDLFFKKANTVLIKNSPILDISSTIKELQFVKEIHIVAVHNEVKELLFLLEKTYQGPIHIKTVNYHKKGIQEFAFNANPSQTSEYGMPETYLYEPNAAILKSGGFHEIAIKYHLKKLHQHSHLYTSHHCVDEFPGRIFKIENVYPFDKRLKKKLSYTKANITTRNFPKPVAQLRKELKLKDGGANYLFFSTDIENRLIAIDCVKNLLKH
jgi:16S rRNA G966 N2-methylase RsmD